MRKRIEETGLIANVLALTDTSIIKPDGGGSGHFQIVEGGSRQFFFTIVGFAYEIAQRSGNSDVTHNIAAGTFDDTNAILTTDFVIVGLN